MHQAVREYIARVVPRLGRPARVLEIGSRNVNGSVREAFAGAEYVGIDRVPGREVDVVTEAKSYDGGGGFDVVLSLEAMEHAERPADITECAARALRPGGTFVLTCATEPRRPHSIDGIRQVPDGEHYRNVPEAELREMLSEGWRDVRVEVDVTAGDLRATAIRC